MRHLKLQILLLTFLGLTTFCSCDTQQDNKHALSKTENLDMHLADIKLTRPLQVGDKIELSGGYDYDPIYLKNPQATNRSGTVIQFIKGQNEEPAAVVRLDQTISGQQITGDVVVLELRYVGQTWQEPTPVHIELCDFMPEDKPWKDRKQGEWVEAAATVKLIQPSK
jgi:hypothetical protein